MKNREHCAVSDRVKKFIDVPGSCQGSRFCFAVTDYGGDNQVGIVKCGAAGMRENISKLSSFMNRTGSFRGAVTTNAPRKRELLEKLAHALLVFAFVGIDLGIGTFQVDWTENARGAMSRAGKVDHVQVILLDQPIEVDVDERQSRTCAPMPQKPVLNVVGLQGLV